ncbi:MAG: carbohydrate-binding protein [Pontiellaceae bacterium]|nr:carbohydrate-binding protein [Pontiellaceae bacterium]MBN2785437.1 carbohydrate-binding protein [Pontiellaceae bacterium]
MTRLFQKTRLALFSLMISSGATYAAGYFTAHFEAENAFFKQGGRIESENFPYIGTGYAVLPEKGSAVAWDNLFVPETGTYILTIKYANGSGAAKPCRLEVNGRPVGTLELRPVFDEWNSYWNARATVKLKAGKNRILLTAVSDAGGPNIDNIALSSATTLPPQSRRFDVRKYGAKGDGTADDTEAIQKAIDACSTGGAVILSDGVFMTGTIRLKSDMTFWIDETATLRAIQKGDLFQDCDPPTQNVSVDDELGKAFVCSQGADNLIITGGGTIDGNGECEIWDINKDESVRPIPVYLTQGKNIQFSHIDVVRGAMWNVVPLESDDVIIDGINIRSTWGMNKDGIDPCDCHRVLIANCTLYVEDDALCPKSGHARGCEDITYRNVTVNHTICGLVKFGTKSYGHFKNMVFEDLALYGHITHKESNVGINLSTVDGAEIEDVIIRRVNMRNAATAVFILHGAGRKSRNPKGSPDKPGKYVRNILIEDVDARECHDPFGNFITGSEFNGKTYKVTDITFRNVRIECKGGLTEIPKSPIEYSGQYPNYDWCKTDLPAWGYYIRHAENIVFENCTEELTSDDCRPRIIAEQSKGIRIDGSELPE